MKSTEWFIRLDYEKYCFYIHHKYVKETSEYVEPEIFIDFDTMVKVFFNQVNRIAHPTAIMLHCRKNALFTTSSIPSVVKVDLAEFKIPGGIMKEKTKEAGIIAMSFTDEKISMIINPELLYEKWSSRK